MMKRLNRKGIEISSSMLVILIIAAVVTSALFLVFGKFIFFTGEGSCDIKSLQYLGDLPYKLSLMSGPKGYNSRESFSFSVPCGDRAYFVNLNKINEEIKKTKDDPNYKSQVLESFSSEPLIKNEFESGTGNNFFIMNGPKIVSATKLPGLSLDYPYNLCFDTKASRKVNIEMEGRGGAGVNVIPYCEQLECTQVPEILQPNEKKNLIYTICGGTDTACKDRCLEDDACYKSCAGVDQACYDTEKQNIENADGNVEVRLRVSTCFPEKTKVEFLVKPQREGIAAKSVKIFETLPKRCVENLNSILDKVEGGDKDVIVNPDPMLIWSLDTVSKEERVAYHLSKFLNDDCRKELRAVAAAELIVNKPLIEAELRKDIEDIKIEEIKVAHLDAEFKGSLGDRGIELPAPQQTVFGLVRIDATTWELTPNPTVKTGKRMKTHRPRFESDQSERIKRGGRGSSIPDELSIVPDSFEKIEEEVDEEDVVSTTGADQVVIDLTNMKRLKDLPSGVTLEFPGLPEGCAADPNNRIARVTCSGGVDIDGVNINIVRTSPNGKVHERSFEVELKEEEKEGGGAANENPTVVFSGTDKTQAYPRNKNNIFGRKIWAFASDKEDSKETMTYTLTKETGGSDKINCILQPKDNANYGDVDCTITTTAISGEKSTFRVVVEDSGGKTDDDTFDVSKR